MQYPHISTSLGFFLSLVAVVIAWGAKFSEHPLLVRDRARNNGQSAIARTLIIRTRELAEDLKVHRVPSADHVVTALLIEPMQNRECVISSHVFQLDQKSFVFTENFDDTSGMSFFLLFFWLEYTANSIGLSSGFHGFWLFSAIRLLLDLQVSQFSQMIADKNPDYAVVDQS
jgi:hypothetical protein